VVGGQRDGLIYEDNTNVPGGNDVRAGVIYADIGRNGEWTLADEEIISRKLLSLIMVFI
jgi:hypothetical protein